MRHDPHPDVLRLARSGHPVLAVHLAYRIATGGEMPPDTYHALSLGLDTVFGDYENLRIADTAPANRLLVDLAKLTPREAETVGDIWLANWRHGRTLNCPKEKT